MISRASSPRVSLARTSPRTRYCCPRLLGSTWSRMSPSRRPPTLVFGDQSVLRHTARRCLCDRTGSGTTEARPPPKAVWNETGRQLESRTSCVLVSTTEQELFSRGRSS